MKSNLSKSPNHNLNTSSIGLNQSFSSNGYTKGSARDRSPMPTIEQALAEKLKSQSELQSMTKEVRNLNTH